jgi:hypothetical protein
MKKLFYSVCLAGFLASCNNEAKNNEAKAADEAKIATAFEEMKAAEMQKVTDECNAMVTAAAQAKMDSINALPKAAQTAIKAAVKKVAPKKAATPVNTKPSFDAKGNQTGKAGGEREEGKNAGNQNVKTDSKGNQTGTAGGSRD